MHYPGHVLLCHVIYMYSIVPVSYGIMIHILEVTSVAQL